MRLEKEWVDSGPNKSEEESATLCYLQIWLGRNNTCRFLDAKEKAAYEWLLMPAVNLAEGLATDWWSIFGKRDYEHRLLLHRRGYLIPDLVLEFDGTRFRISSRGGSWPEECISILAIRLSFPKKSSDRPLAASSETSCPVFGARE